MNKQELIKKYKRLEGVWNAPGAETARQIFLQDLEQLDEPEKVKVPQFVADWYEEHKDDFEFNVWDWIAFRDELEKLENKEFTSWINDCEGNPIQILVNMHQFGYEVEKKLKYTVKIKATKHYFAKDGNGRIYFSLKYESAFTKIELEKVNLGWVFDCEGIEVEELEE